MAMAARMHCRAHLSLYSSLVWSCLDAWEADHYCALKEVEECSTEDGFARAHPDCGIEFLSRGCKWQSLMSWPSLMRMALLHLAKQCTMQCV
jgi:hypothetical protein